MSHVVTIKTEIRDAVAVRAACRRLGLVEPTLGTAKLFSGQARGLIVRLPRWKYPAVCDTATGEIHYDNYQGRWGEQAELDRFKQAYMIEKARIEARKRGHSITETPLADGSIKLTIQVAGGAA